MCNCSSFRENCVTHARTHAPTHAPTHARTHAHGANYNLPPASRAGDHYSKCNSFQVTTDLLNSENLKGTITQLCNELHV